MNQCRGVTEIPKAAEQQSSGLFYVCCEKNEFCRKIPGAAQGIPEAAEQQKPLCTPRH